MTDKTLEDAWETGGYTAVATLRDSIEKTKDLGGPQERLIARGTIQQLDVYLAEMDPTGRLAREYAEREAQLAALLGEDQS